ncbi:MAG: hypothetical protein R6X25_02990 [Candidatus Krumholzibacteriia bacterium]
MYRADLAALNAEAIGFAPRGTATLTVSGDSLMIEIEMQDTPPGIMHLQHIHGFTGAGDATCAEAAQDVNGDGIVDLVETEAVSGTTLIPFHADPADLRIAADSYPVADADGRYRYRQQVALPQLQSALQEQLKVASLSLQDRVIYVHGVPAETRLPATVQSLPDVPAHVTLPIACGELTRVQERVQ